MNWSDILKPGIYYYWIWKKEKKKTKTKKKQKKKTKNPHFITVYTKVKTLPFRWVEKSKSFAAVEN